jgi:hypothetical protein
MVSRVMFWMWTSRNGHVRAGGGGFRGVDLGLDGQGIGDVFHDRHISTNGHHRWCVGPLKPLPHQTSQHLSNGRFGPGPRFIAAIFRARTVAGHTSYGCVCSISRVSVASSALRTSKSAQSSTPVIPLAPRPNPLVRCPSSRTLTQHMDRPEGFPTKSVLADYITSHSGVVGTQWGGRGRGRG